MWILDSDFKMGRILDSNFNPWSLSFGHTWDSGCVFQNKTELPWIRRTFFFNFLGFKFQSNFPGFIFRNGLDSGFKFQIGGIQDSDLGLQGPIYIMR